MSTGVNTAKGPPCVLIVDDERQNRQLLEVMLGQEGYCLLTASSGEEALAVVSKQRPDAIVLDVMMPGMTGYEVLARLKADAATKHIPIIMLTALDDRSSRMHGMSAGAQDFFTKPVNRTDLCELLRKLLPGRQPTP